MCHTWGLAHSPAELQGGPVEVPLDVPDLVHLVAQHGSELDPKCNAAPPANSIMAARGLQNGRRGLERCLP